LGLDRGIARKPERQFTSTLPCQTGVLEDYPRGQPNDSSPSSRTERALHHRTAVSSGAGRGSIWRIRAPRETCLEQSASLHRVLHRKIGQVSEIFSRAGEIFRIFFLFSGQHPSRADLEPITSSHRAPHREIGPEISSAGGNCPNFRTIQMQFSSQSPRAGCSTSGLDIANPLSSRSGRFCRFLLLPGPDIGNPLSARSRPKRPRSGPDSSRASGGGRFWFQIPLPGSPFRAGFSTPGSVKLSHT